MTSAFNCPSCGGTVTLRAPGKTLAIACTQCRSVIDAQDPKHKILSEYNKGAHIDPALPLGSRGKLRGEELEVIGYLRRAVNYYGVNYEWAEYLLFNPYKGFRWLVESDGHWTLLKTPTSPPK